jgi:hypothetical protein
LDNTKLRELENITQEGAGYLIQSDRWNNNFNKIIDTVNDNNEIVKKNFDNIKASTVPSPAINSLGQTAESNIADQLLLLSNKLLEKVDSSVYESGYNSLIKDVSFNSTNGVFTFTRGDGSQFEYDTDIEKIPVKAEIVEEDDSFYIVLTNEDGSTSRTDVANILRRIVIQNSNTISAFSSKSNNTDTYTLEINEKSIEKKHFADDFTKLFDESVTSVSANAVAAKTSEDNAKQYAESANDSKNAAVNSELNAKSSEELSGSYATASRSYALGDTNTRTNEATTNAKYYSDLAREYTEQAQAIVGGDFATIFIQNNEPAVKNCLWIIPQGEIVESSDGIALLSLSDDTDTDYTVEVDGEDKGIKNTVNSDEELTTSSYSFDIL